jgi:hypothetical protein
MPAYAENVLHVRSSEFSVAQWPPADTVTEPQSAFIGTLEVRLKSTPQAGSATHFTGTGLLALFELSSHYRWGLPPMIFVSNRK